MRELDDDIHISVVSVLAFLVLTFLAWAAFFEIDEAVISQGKIIANSRTQIIQVLDGGVLEELFVSEGDLVERGQLLAVLNDQRAKPAYDEILSKVMALEASLVRLNAEIGPQPLVFGEQFKKFPEFVASQKGLFEQRLKSLTHLIDNYKASLDIAKSELSSKERLLKNGDISRMEVLRSRQQVAEIEGRISDARNKYLQESRVEITKVEDELKSQRERLAERLSMIEKLNLVAPVSGKIKDISVTTIGGVLRPSQEIMQIAPEEGGVVLEARILPAEIGRLHEGLPVTIKIDAYDYSVYGTLVGELIYISPDTLVEESDKQSYSYYRIHVRISDEQLNDRSKNMPLKLGMSGSIHIVTGRRTVLMYIAKPIIKSFNSALSER